MVVDTLETVFSLTDHYTGRAQKAIEATKDLARAQDQVTGVGSGDGSGGLPGYFKLATAELDSAIPGLQELLGVLKGIGLAAVGTGLAFAGFTAYSIQQFAEFDSLTTALRVYAKTAEETERQLRRLREVAQAPGLGYAEAIQGSVRLQAIGFDARLAERALLAMGNALASSGGGKAELDGIILALSQIVSKGSISAEEINQITERLPQFREVLKQTFGTADSEKLQKAGIGVEKFVLQVVDALERLPKSAGSAQTSLENIADTWSRIVNQFGKTSFAALDDALLDLEKFGSYLERKSVIGDMVTELYRGFQVGSAFATTLKEAATDAVKISEYVADTSRSMGDIHETIGFFGVALREIVAEPLNFLKNAQDFGDFLVRSTALAVVTIAKIPQILDISMKFLGEQLKAIKDFVNGVIEAINNVIKSLNGGVDIVGPGGIPLGHVGPSRPIEGLNAIGDLGEDSRPKGFSEAEKAINKLVEGIADDAERLYKDFRNDKQKSELDGDKTKGSIRGGVVQAVTATEQNTLALQRNTQATERLIDLNRQLQGGGGFADVATSELAIARATGRTGLGDPDLEKAMHHIAKYASRAAGLQVRSNARRVADAGAF